MSEPAYHYLPHPLDELELFGFTGHGLVRRLGVAGSSVRDVDGVIWPQRWGQFLPSGYPMQIISRPGIAPVPLTPEKMAAERTQGRVWQNYSLLSDGWNLYGQNGGGWVYWDSNNEPWLIRPSNADGAPIKVGEGDEPLPFSLTLRCVRIHAIGAQQHAPVELTASVEDTTQRAVAGASPDRYFRFSSINRRGSLALVRIRAGLVAIPIGYLQVELSETDEGISAAMSVLRSQEDTLGEWEQTYPEGTIPPHAGPWKYYDYYATGTLSPASEEGRHPVGRGSSTLTLNGSEMRELATGTVNSLIVGAHVEHARRSGRLINLAFDDQDELIEFRVDSDRTTEYDYPQPDIQVSGSFTGTPTQDPAISEPENGFPFSDSQWSGSATVHLSRTVRETFRARLTLRRNGVTVAEDELVRELKSDQALAFIRSTAGGSSWAAPRKTPSGTWGMAGIINFVNTALPGNGYTLLTEWTNPRALITGSLEAIGPYGAKILRDTPRSISTLGVYDLIGGGDMPLRADDLDGVRLSVSIASAEPPSPTVRYEAITRVEANGLGAISSRTVIVRNLAGTTISSERTELSLDFVAASAPGRGLIASSEGSVAYHPVTHEIVTDQTGGAPITFV